MAVLSAGAAPGAHEPRAQEQQQQQQQQQDASRDPTARNLGIAMDTVAVGEHGVSPGFGIAGWATNLGFGIASACIRAPAAGLEYAAGPNPVSAGLHGVNSVVGLAHGATRAGQELARGITQASLQATKAGLTAAGAQGGQLLQLAVGQEAADTVAVIEDMVRSYVEPMSGISRANLLTAASAWSVMQRAAGVGAAGSGQAAALPERSERWMRFAAATFGSTWLAGMVEGLSLGAAARAREASERGGGPGELALAWAGVGGQVEIVEFEQSSKQHFFPGYLVAVDHATGHVVIALRGTSSMRDMLTDLVCQPADLELGGVSGIAHSGMLQAARNIEAKLAALAEAGLASLAATGRKPRLMVIGHSLGAGVAALVTALWRDQGRFAGVELGCVAFACPQVLDQQLSEAVSNFTASILFGDDLVPRFSLATSIDLRAATLHVHSPQAHGLPTTALSAQEVLAAAARGDSRQLAEAHAEVRRAISPAEGRLFPAGRLVYLAGAGRSPERAEPRAFDELLISATMVSDHMPQRYLQAVMEASAQSS
ncbi:unnamed protein product [Polarella glacialis]|uniref:sn-1-specific diacylglycerol lipase n=1 Tax=Polarella glacialis TaxID=89957 RepID=A0A813DPT4_POLGL|nr:unnamed protein product [Polarella glacialis]